MADRLCKDCKHFRKWGRFMRVMDFILARGRNTIRLGRCAKYSRRPGFIATGAPARVDDLEFCSIVREFRHCGLDGREWEPRRG